MEVAIMANKSSYREIVEHLLTINGQHEPPINVSNIAKNLGITVLEATMPQQDISGFIAKQGDDKLYIYVNENEHINRQRFTIAHELAHYYLHYKDSEDILKTKDGVLDFVKYRNGQTYDSENNEEREANALAAELLVPFNALKDLWNNGHTDVTYLAHVFAVSVEMMIIRLRGCIRELNRETRC